MFEMEDLPMKPAPVKRKSTVGKRPPDLNKPVPPKRLSQEKRELMSKPLPPVQKRSQLAKTTAARPKKSLPSMRTPGEQPRDSLGRFASKAGAAIWGATKATAKGTVKAAKGTARVVGKAHKTIKQVNAASRKRRNIELRERAAAVREREKRLGKRKVSRRKR